MLTPVRRASSPIAIAGARESVNGAARICPCSCSRYSMQAAHAMSKPASRLTIVPLTAITDDTRSVQGLAAAGGLVGALAASACCIVPLVLFSLGISGAWIGKLTSLAPYQPYFLAVTAVCLGSGYWMVYRSRSRACANG